MTKHELLARLVREPIVIQSVANLACYRIGLHGVADRSAVVIGAGLDGDDWFGDDHEYAYACVDGRTVRLTSRDVQAIAGPLRRIFARGRIRR